MNINIYLIAITAILLAILIISIIYFVKYNSKDTTITIEPDKIKKTGTWSDWKEVDGCDAKCGGGHKLYTRQCLDSMCSGSLTKVESCNTQSCD
jgi:hypothetical protein